MSCLQRRWIGNARRTVGLAALLVGSLAAGARSGQAADFIWKNAGTNWGDPANWIPAGGPPGGGDFAILNRYRSTGPVSPDLQGGTFSVRGLAIDNFSSAYNLTNSSGTATLTIGSG